MAYGSWNPLNIRVQCVTNGLGRCTIILEYSQTNIYEVEFSPQTMPKVSLDMPGELVDDLKLHVGDDKKFVSLADAIRTACRKLLDQLDSIDLMHGRGRT